MEERVRGRGEEHTLSALVFFYFFIRPSSTPPLASFLRERVQNPQTLVAYDQALFSSR